MISVSCLTHLATFIKSPTALNASLLIEAPAIYHWLAYEFMEGNGMTAGVVELCTWLHATGTEVIQRLKTYTAPEERAPGEINEEDWRKVGYTCYFICLLITDDSYL